MPPPQHDLWRYRYDRSKSPPNRPCCPTAREAPADRLPPWETAVPTPSAGQVLLKVRYLSLEPYMRGRMDGRKSYAKPVPLGGVMNGESVATVIASQHPGYLP